MNGDIRCWIRRLKDLPFVSAILVFVNVITFLICTFTGNLLYNMGSISAWNLMHEEYYRLITSMFLHVNAGHLVNNMLILFGIGYMIEKELGHFRFGVYYMVSGLCGNLLSAWMEILSGNFTSSIGASGAVFGLDGVLLALVLFSGKKIATVTLPRLLFMIGYSLYSGFTAYNINNAAHIGGLLAGFVLGTLFCVICRIRGGRIDVRAEGLKEE